MNDPIKILRDRLEAYKGRSLDRFEYAVYLTIDLTILCQLYFSYLIDTDVRNKVVRHIQLRADSDNTTIPIWFLDKLLKEFSRSEGRKRISIGTTIKALASYLDDIQIKAFITDQILSESVLDRKRAYVLTETYYDIDIEHLLRQSWNTYKDPGCMAVLVKQGSIENLVELFDVLWKSQNTKFYIRNNALKRVAKYDFEKVIFLKNDSPVSYLTACIAAKHDVDDNYLLTVAKDTTAINELGYVLWCIGKLGKANVLYKLLDELETIEENLPVEFWEPEFYGIA